MDDITFHCAACRQKIAIEAQAVGMRIDCPRCRSTIVVPASPAETVVVEVRRRLAILGGAEDGAYRMIETQKTRLGELAEETAKFQEENQRLQADLGRLREEASRGRTEREALAVRVGASEAVREASEIAQVRLADLRRTNLELETERDEYEIRAAKAEQEGSGLRDGLVAAEKERSEMKAQIAFLQEQLAGFQKPHLDGVGSPAAEETPVKLPNGVSNLATERDDHRTGAGRGSNEFEAAQAEAAGLKAVTSELAEQPEPGSTGWTTEKEERLAEARSWGAELSREVANLHRQLDSLRAEQGTESPDAAKELRELKASRDELRERLSRGEARLAEAFETVGIVTAERDEARRRLGEARETVDDARAKRAVADLETERLQIAMEAVAAESEKVRREKSAIQLHTAILEDELRARNAEIASLRTRGRPASAAEAAGDGADRTRAETEELRGKLSAAEEARRTYEILVEEADLALNEAQAQIAALNTERRDRVGSSGEEATGVSGLPSEIRHLKESRNELEATVRRIESKLARSLDHARAMEAERDEIKAELEAVKTSPGQTSEAGINVRSRREQIHSEISRLKGPPSPPPPPVRNAAP